MGIEPTLRAWEAPVLPLNYTRPVSYILQGLGIILRTCPELGKPADHATARFR